MQVAADLHLHSKYSRAVSPQMLLPTMAQVALEKGLQLLTTSDWTHPVWFKEMSGLLEESGEGVYALKSEFQNSKLETVTNFQNTNSQKNIHFVLSTEISCIYKQGDKLRRIHILIFVSSLEKAEAFSRVLVSKGCNLGSDGRPIIGFTAKQVLEMLLETDDKGFLIPCHVWTPHFGLYGSASGFDSIEEAFGDLSESIYGIETGLSSDPEMNWQILELKNRSILSFSDAHSISKMAREATFFELEKVDFPHLKQAVMKESSPQNKILFTVEFYPEEGKYHFSGHRSCKIRLTPQELKEKGNTCPICKRSLTEGVFVRLSQLAGRDTLESAVITPNEQHLNWYLDPDKIHPPYVKLVPLLEIIAEALKSTVMSQKVKLHYNKALSQLGSELDILLKIPKERIASTVGEQIAEAVDKVRRGDIVIEPGYDGEYGIVKIWNDENKHVTISNKPQLSLDF